MLNDFEHKYKGTKQGIVNSFLAMLPLLQNQTEGQIEEFLALLLSIAGLRQNGQEKNRQPTKQ